MNNYQKEMLKASPTLVERDELFYSKEFPLGNLYYLLYYNFNDANDAHFSNAAASISDDKEMLNNCIAIIRTVCDLEEICEKDFFEKYDFPESVEGTINEVKAAIYKT